MRTTLLCLFFSIFILCSCKEKSHQNYTVNKINDWYYDNECIEEKLDSSGDIIERDEKEKNLLISTQKILLNLDDKWTFFNQEIQLNKLTETEYQIKTDLTFKNKSQDFAILRKTFYYDAEAVIPIPIKEYIVRTLDKKIHTEDERYLWNGDFNDYMKFYFELEIKKTDSQKEDSTF